MIRFDWLIALYIFTLFSCNASFLIRKKQLCQGRTQKWCVFSSDTTSTDQCARTSFWWVRIGAPYLWYVHLPNWHFPLHLPISVCVHYYQPALQLQPHLRGIQFPTLSTLAEEGVPIFDPHICFSLMAITTFVLAWRYASVSIDCPQMTFLICCYSTFVTQLSYLSAMVWRLSVKVLLTFILYLIIAYFTQFSPLLFELTPSAEHSVRFANYPTSLLWDSSEILYSPLRRTNFTQATTSTEIDPIIHAFISLWNIPDPIEDKPDHQFVLIWHQSQ